MIKKKEATIETLKNEIRANKSQMTQLNITVKNLQKENIEYKETLNIKKLQMRIKPNENNYSPNQIYEELSKLDRINKDNLILLNQINDIKCIFEK